MTLKRAFFWAIAAYCSFIIIDGIGFNPISILALISIHKFLLERT